MKKLIIFAILLLSVFENVFSYDWKGREDVGSYKDFGYSYQLKDHFDTFKYGDREFLLKKFPMLIKKAGIAPTYDKECEWYETPFFSDIFIDYENNYIEISCEVKFKIINFVNKNEIVELDVKFIGYNDKPISESNNMDWPYMDDIESVYKIILKFDGDFIYVYVNNMSQLFHVYCKMYVQDLIRFNECMATNNFDDLSEVIWPHHADGTSEYEDTIRYPDPVVIEEPEEIEIEEYKEENNKPPYPDEKDPHYKEILKEYYPEDYSALRFAYYQKRRFIINKIIIPSSIVLGLFLIVFIIIKKKRKSAK